MDKAIQQVFRRDAAPARNFIRQQGGAVAAGLTVLDRYVNRELPVYINPDPIQNQLFHQQLEEWAEIYDDAVKKFMDQATTFEFMVTLNVNVFYPCLLFPTMKMYEACEDLSKRFQIKIKSDMVLYVLCYIEIIRNRRMTMEDVMKLAQKKGVPYRDLTEICIVPRGVWNGHPLKDIDVDSVAPAESKRSIGNVRDSVSMNRERRYMQNRIVREANVFKLKEKMSSFADKIKLLNRPLTEEEE